MNIRDLPDKWRDDEENIGGVNFFRSGYDCAKELQAALPQWTRITENEATWPAEDWDTVVWYSDEDNSHAMGPIPFVDVGRFTHWRPLVDIDFPPDD